MQLVNYSLLLFRGDGGEERWHGGTGGESARYLQLISRETNKPEKQNK